MNEMNISLKSEVPIDFHNPFIKDSITNIIIRIEKPNCMNELGIKASIWFKNNNTTGIHEIKSSDFGILVKQINDFIDSL